MLPVYYLCTERVVEALMIVPDWDKAASNKLDPRTESIQPMIYQIRIKGHLGREWADWFEGMTITLEDNGETFLTGPVVDQAALYGLLKRVRDLGLVLLSINPVESDQANMSGIKQ
jgi:hypothetical protein